nr:pyruvate kinase isozyme A, chloroplastic-like isoform X2 [Ipomoea batatas]
MRFGTAASAFLVITLANLRNIDLKDPADFILAFSHSSKDPADFILAFSHSSKVPADFILAFSHSTGISPATTGILSKGLVGNPYPIFDSRRRVSDVVKAQSSKMLVTNDVAGTVPLVLTPVVPVTRDSLVELKALAANGMK